MYKGSLEKLTIGIQELIILLEEMAGSVQTIGLVAP